MKARLWSIPSIAVVILATHEASTKQRAVAEQNARRAVAKLKARIATQEKAPVVVKSAGHAIWTAPFHGERFCTETIWVQTFEFAEGSVAVQVRVIWPVPQLVRFWEKE